MCKKALVNEVVVAEQSAVIAQQSYDELVFGLRVVFQQIQVVAFGEEPYP